MFVHFQNYSYSRIDLRAAHRYPLAVGPEERFCPGGGRRQHAGRRGGLLLCLQSGRSIYGACCLVRSFSTRWCCWPGEQISQQCSTESRIFACRSHKKDGAYHVLLIVWPRPLWCAQVYYMDRTFVMGHVVIRRKRTLVGAESQDVVLFRCIQRMTHTYPFNTCYTGGEPD